MARVHGRRGRLYAGIASDTAAAEPVTFLSSWSIDFTVDKADVTCLGDTNKTYVSGLPDASGSFGGFYDTATAQLYLDIWTEPIMHVLHVITCGAEGDMRQQVCSCGWRAIEVPAADHDGRLEPCAVLVALQDRAQRMPLALSRS